MKRKTDAQRILDAVAPLLKPDPRWVSFKTSDQDYLLIAKIAKRAVLLGMKLEVEVDCTEISMDITACHANGNPLRLADLLKADNGNFGHDVFGIRRFLDRETGKLTGCFLPRFSVKKVAV